MASYTDNIFPSDDKSSGFTNPTHAWNTSDSSYAYKSIYGLGAETATYAAKWSPQTIKNQLLRNWEYIKIDSVKLITRIRVPEGTGNIKTVKWSFNYNGDFDQSSSPNTEFKTSFKDYPNTLTDSRYNILTNGALAQIDVDNNRFTTQQVQISAFYLQINYTIPDITYTYVDYDGSFIDTRVVEQGSTPAHPQGPTRPSTAEYDYTFSGWSLSGTTYTAQYTAKKREYLIRVLISPEEGGYPLIREYYYEYGTETYLIVVPRPGYKFAGWDDGTFGEIVDLQPNGFGFKKDIIVTGVRDYIAYFEPVYITYDSIFNYLDWKNKGITVTNGTASNITNTGLTLTTNADKTSSRTSSPFFPVEYGKSYKIDIDIEGLDWTVYIFFCDADENRIDFVDATHKFSSSGAGVPSRIFTAPDNPSVVQAQIRLDCRGGGGGTATYHNFRIFPAEYEYMSTTVDENERVDYGSWSMPTPIRGGYEFIGWNTKPDGSGETYTNQSALPTEDLTLYSQWESKALNSIYIGNKLVREIYIGTNKVKEVYIGTTKIYG